MLFSDVDHSHAVKVGPETLMNLTGPDFTFIKGVLQKEASLVLFVLRALQEVLELIQCFVVSKG